MDSLDVVRGHSCGAWAQWWCAGLVAPWHRDLSSLAKDLHPLYCKVDFYPLAHQGSPYIQVL